MTESRTPQHPWAKYYKERGRSRVGVADFTPPVAGTPRARANGVAAVKKTEISADLAAAVAAVTSKSAIPGATGTPFLSAMQKEAIARELKRLARVRLAKMAASVVAALVVLHVIVTQFVNTAPSAEALLAHVQSLPQAVLPLYSSHRQPLQADGVVITQADDMKDHYRYVATVTLRLRQPLYAPAVSNGTAQYRRLQEAVQVAREQEMRYTLFAATEAPKLPSLPVLLQRSHQRGETVVIRVPFTARRFGWHWRLAAPQLPLRTANRTLEGDSLERYEDTPYLIFGAPKTLADMRQRLKLANDYVLAVAKQVQKNADVVAVSDTAGIDPSIAFQPALEPNEDLANVVAAVEVLPAFDPHAPAVTLPGPSQILQSGRPTSRR